MARNDEQGEGAKSQLRHSDGRNPEGTKICSFLRITTASKLANLIPTEKVLKEV